MQLEPISKADVLAAMENSGTRPAKIAAVGELLDMKGVTRCYQDDTLTVITHGMKHMGWARRHVTNGKDVRVLAEWVYDDMVCDFSADGHSHSGVEEMKARAERILEACDEPDADRGMSIAACGLLR